MDDYRSQARRRWAEQQSGSSDAREDIRGRASMSSSASTSTGAGAGSVGNASGTTRSGAAHVSGMPGAAGGASSSGASNVPATPEVGGELWVEAFLQWWARLPQDQRNQIIGASGLALAILVLGQRIVPILLLAALCIFLHGRLPTTASFEPFFRQWFTEDYFPKVSQKMQQELQERAKRQSSVIDSLATQFKGWVMGKTEALQATAWYELHIRHFCLPAQFRDVYFMRTASVNLGSRQQPCIVTFWGIAGLWMLNPLQHIDFQNVSLLDEIAKQNAAAAATPVARH